MAFIGMLVGLAVLEHFVSRATDVYAVRDAEGVIVEGGILGTALSGEMRVGDCLVEARWWGRDADVMTGVPCSEPHDFEVIATFDLSVDHRATFPGDSHLESYLTKSCDTHLREYVGRPLGSVTLVRLSELDGLHYVFWWPTEESWEEGQRRAECWLTSTDGTKLAGSLRHGNH